MRSCHRTSFAEIADRLSTMLSFLAVAGLFILAGCQKRDEITRYNVKKLSPVERKAPAETSDGSTPKTRAEDQPGNISFIGDPLPDGSTPETPATDQGPPDRDRMLAAIVPHGKMAWFFKVIGPRDAVAAKMEDFLKLIRSLTFAGGEDSQPEWVLPEGWTSEKGNGIRFATLRVKSEDEVLETTVIRLSAPDPHSGEYVLSNVNRWCEQLGLPPRTKTDLAAEEQPKNAEIRQFEAAGTMVTLVNLVGRPKSDGMGAAPFAGGIRPLTTVPEQPRAEADSGRPTWTVPESWKETKGNQFSLAAFAVQEGDKLVKTTVSAAGGDLLANVNRWRGQLQLDSWSKEELANAAKTLSVDGVEAPFVELIGQDVRTGEPSCTLGVIVPRGDRSWFFKLTGDVGLARREKANFEKFVQSVKFK